MASGLQNVDIAFVAIWLFLGFFTCLVFYLRREDRREGYPLEEDVSGVVTSPGAFIYIPKPKAFAMASGEVISAPNLKRDTRKIAARRTSVTPGSPYVPTGNGMVDGVGPGAWADRANVPDTMINGKPKIVPLRAAPDITIAKEDADPRGMLVVGADGVVAGAVVDVWVDVPEQIVRYLEVKLSDAVATVLVPMPMALLNTSRRFLTVDAITAAQFANVPRISSPNQVTFY